jgi:hypothetical protein
VVIFGATRQASDDDVVLCKIKVNFSTSCRLLATVYF